MVRGTTSQHLEEVDSKLENFSSIIDLRDVDNADEFVLRKKPVLNLYNFV